MMIAKTRRAALAITKIAWRHPGVGCALPVRAPCLIRASLLLLAPSSPSVMSSGSASLLHAPAEQLPSSRRRQGVELTWNQQRRQVKSYIIEVHASRTLFDGESTIA